MSGFETILPFLKPIEHLILDDSVSEVMVNGPDTVFIERAGYLQPVSGVSLGERALLVAVKNIARRLGGDISESHPILDSRLPDGSRVAAIIPPCSLNGVTLTIRKFNTRHFEMQDLIAAGTLDQSLANRLEDYVLSRKNILICGGTGSGKTTTLNILGKFIPEDERILLIEDTAEIHLAHANLVRFEARHPQNGLPGIAIRDLLKASLRHRPDRILLGEIRDVELPYRAIKSNIGDSLHVVIQIERRPGRRYISEVLEINSYDPDSDLFDYCAIYQRQEATQ
jgi:pilus assembly protein CpaF